MMMMVDMCRECGAEHTRRTAFAEEFNQRGAMLFDGLAENACGMHAWRLCAGKF
jgi:hypothetical protein